MLAKSLVVVVVVVVTRYSFSFELQGVSDFLHSNYQVWRGGLTRNEICAFLIGKERFSPPPSLFLKLQKI